METDSDNLSVSDFSSKSASFSGMDIELESLTRKQESPEFSVNEEIDEIDEINQINQIDKSFKYKIWNICKLIWNGPDKPNDKFETFETAPLVIYKFNRIPNFYLKNINKFYKFIIFFLYFGSLIITTKLIYHHILFETPKIDDIELIALPCGNTDKFWLGFNDKCGLNAENCLEKFNKNENILVKCPAFCNGGGLTYDIIKFADKEVQYEPYIIKSVVNDELTNLPIYRADTFPCIAAYKQGIISSMFGGSFSLNMSNNFPFDSNIKKEKDIDGSYFFNSKFPASFTINPIDKKFNHELNNIYDFRIISLFIGIFYCILIAIISFNSKIFYFTSLWILYTTIVLSCDTPITVNFKENLIGGSSSAWELLSIYFARIIPLSFMIITIWFLIGNYTFNNEKIGSIQRIIFLIGCWITGLDNLTFERLPIDRLIISDIKNQNGGIMAFLLIILIILSCGIIQAIKIWKAGWFKRAFFIYSILIFLIFWLGFGASGILHIDNEFNHNGLILRIHHWIIGLLLIYGCKNRWNGAYLMQGLCTGLIINGIGKWGFASIFERENSIIRDFDEINHKINKPIDIIYDKFSNNITVVVDDNSKFDRIKLLVNDIEIYEGPELNIHIENENEMNDENEKIIDYYVRAAICFHDDCSGFSAAMRY